MIPSTPRSSSRFISAGSLTVQTCTCRPRRCAAATTGRRPPGSAAARAAPGRSRRPSGAAHPAAARAPHAAERRAQPRAEPGPDAAGPAAVRTSRCRSGRPRRSGGPPPPRVDRGRRLDVDVDAQVRVGAEQLVQPRHRLPAADPGLGDLDPRQRPDRAAAVGGAAKARVVEQHGDPVRGRTDVGLQVAEAQRDDAVDRGEGVLQLGRGAAMRERDRPVRIQEPESRRHGDSMPDGDVTPDRQGPYARRSCRSDQRRPSVRSAAACTRLRPPVGVTTVTS